MSLKTAICPRKTRNKSVLCIASTDQPSDNNLPHSISLKIFVLFVSFVDNMIFP